jgi:hypothetical protein
VDFLNHALVCAAKALALGCALLFLCRRRLPPWLAWSVAAVGGLGFLVSTFLDLPRGADLDIFWSAGGAVWRGENPYADPRVLNPPTALPFFAALAVLPWPPLLALWTVVNALGYVGLVPLARRALLPATGPGRWQLPATAVAVLTAAVVLSFPTRYGLGLGQLSVLTTLCLLAALHAQARGRPIRAGVWLALATIKIGTMLPFLLLFRRRRDLPTWVSLGVTSLGLCLLTTPPGDLASRCRNCVRNISALGGAGGINDYAYANASSVDLISLDHALYRVGLRDRAVIQAAQWAALGALGAWVVWQTGGRRPLPRGAACSLVALYSAVFLYHRIYDMIILVLPLTYCAGRALTAQGRGRWLFVTCALAVLGVVYLRIDPLRDLTAVAADGHGPANYLLQAVVLPYGTWLVLFALLCLPAAERLSRPKLAAVAGARGARLFRASGRAARSQPARWPVAWPGGPGAIIPWPRKVPQGVGATEEAAHRRSGRPSPGHSTPKDAAAA